MELLTAVNQVLPKLGERPVTSLEVKHPTLAVLLPIIEQTLKEVLGRGWWFNRYDYTAHPNTEGQIVLGTTTLSFVPDRADVAVQRGPKLFNPVTLNYTFTQPVHGTVTQWVDFNELPESAATYVLYASLVNAYVTDLGMTQEVQAWQMLAGQGWSDLMSEHLRQKKHSTRKSRRWGKLMHALHS